jgi:hypothetical protein
MHSDAGRRKVHTALHELVFFVVSSLEFRNQPACSLQGVSCCHSSIATTALRSENKLGRSTWLGVGVRVGMMDVVMRCFLLLLRHPSK